MDRREQFFKALEATFGPRNLISSKFGTNSFGDIADKLSLSKSLMTKLVAGTATEGMYQRCLKNIERINRQNQTNQEITELKEKLVRSAQSKKSIYKYVPIALAILLLIGFAIWKQSQGDESPMSVANSDISKSSSDFLANFFEPPFETPHFLPYVPSDKVQDYCPCSAFEGQWELEKPYVIPVPDREPGLYYLANESSVRLKCALTESGEMKGRVMHGFEVMTHKVLLDIEREPLIPRLFDPGLGQFTSAYYDQNYADSSRFVCIAEISSFFYNRLTFDEDRITRIGEPCGRTANYVNSELVHKYQVNVDHILNNVVGDMIKVKCNEIANPYCNPNSLREGESTLDFACEFDIKTENLGIGGMYPYRKSYKLVNQNYSENVLCNCESSL